jgi:hypothetical protein
MGMPDALDAAETDWLPEIAPPQLPLRALANVLTVLLAVLTVAIAARICLHEIGWRSTGSSWSASSPSYWLDHVTDMATFAIVILFLVWFRRARINAEHHGWRQRRALHPGVRSA